jgi:putative N-acetyltransferase (TIGR04045 family)
MRALPGLLGDEQPAIGSAGTDRARIVMTPVQVRGIASETGDVGHNATASVVCIEALTPEHRAMHHRIRRAVFVEEQAIFADSDVDDHDARDDVVRVLALRGVEPVGAVRLYPLDERLGLWKGDRLAVLPDCRTCGAGGPLVRFAVAYAGAHGGRRMVAHIQAANVRFFEHLGWSVCGGAEDYLGLTHQPMDIALVAG